MVEQCYLCGEAVGDGAAAVCAGCVRGHLAPPVRHTADFAVPVIPAELAEHAPSAATPDAGACSWCGKPGGAVKKLLGNGTVSICNECVALCADVMDAELGSGWRG